MNKFFRCCICKTMVFGYGNNAEPVKKNGICCNECNADVVVPARISEMIKNAENE